MLAINLPAWILAHTTSSNQPQGIGKRWTSDQHQGSDGMYHTAYSMLSGPQTVGGNPSGTKFSDIKDGAGNTAMVVEACRAQIVWSEPRDVNIADQPAGINLKGHRPGHSKGWLSSFHARGAHVLLADGSVRFVSSATHPACCRIWPGWTTGLLTNYECDFGPVVALTTYLGASEARTGRYSTQ
jgi:prepilin-type processing-associated H-X9-DG protein